MAGNFFIEVAKGSVARRGFIVPLSKLPSLAEEASKTGTELYRSYYLFDREIVEHFKVFKTVKSYRGRYFINTLLFDLDKKENTDEFTLMRAKVFVEKLRDEWKVDEDAIQVWFSGRGYHINIPDIFGFTPSSDLPKEVSRTLQKYFPEADDIYDGSRLIRVGYSLNEKSGKFKIPLPLDEFMDISFNDVQELSSSSRMDVKFPSIRGKEDKKYSDLIIRTTDKSDLKLDEPSRIVTCMQKLYLSPSEVGSRHLNMLRMASAFRRAGIPKEGVQVMLRQWAPTLEPYEVDRSVEDVFRKSYRFSCSDPIMQKYCDQRCIFYKSKDYTMNVTSAGDLESKFVKFIQEGIPNSSFNLQDTFRLPKPFWVYPKEFISIIGDTGLGKTALYQNILLDLGMDALVLNFEISDELLYRRNVQIKYGMTKEEVMNHYRVNTNSLSKGVDFIKVLSTSPEISAISRLVAEVGPKILVIDTIEDIKSSFKNPLERLQDIAVGLKEIALLHNIIVIGIHHTSKSGSQDEKGRPRALTVHSGKGPSTVEQKSDKVLALEGERDTVIRTIRSLKARDETPFIQAFNFNVSTFRFEVIGMKDSQLELYQK